MTTLKHGVSNRCLQNSEDFIRWKSIWVEGFVVSHGGGQAATESAAGDGIWSLCSVGFASRWKIRLNPHCLNRKSDCLWAVGCSGLPWDQAIRKYSCLTIVSEGEAHEQTSSVVVGRLNSRFA